MKVLDLVAEIRDIVETSTTFPLSGKIMVDGDELLEIADEIERELPEEIKNAQWISNEKTRILDEAKAEYEMVINDAKRQADILVENNDIVVRAKIRADEIMRITEENCKQLKLNTFDYVDKILYNFQDKMDQMSATYFAEMVEKMEHSFRGISSTIVANRNEIKELAYKTQMETDEDM